MPGPADSAVAAFGKLTDRTPYKWQERLLRCWFVEGRIPDAVDIPTGLGKTAAMALWLAALSVGVKLPRRLIYVVDRRTVVDQATEEAEKLVKALGDGSTDDAVIREIRRGLKLAAGKKLAVSTLRGQHIDNREWLETPAAPAIVIGTVDMIGSRLLFEGYGVSPRMRPVHAGLIGADALVMLDEAHLVPPFAALLRSVAQMPAPEPVPRFHLMTLSATGREQPAESCEHTRFGLEAEDWDDEPVRARLVSPKRVLIEPTVQPKELSAHLADRAWQLGEGGRRVIVYCQRRTVAQQVREKIDEKAKRNGLAHVTELVVGARRVHERERLRSNPVFERFLPEASSVGGDDARPAFLVATSAGEVGVDIDADHMVCDLVPWERMVQRFGRVNRLGRPNIEKIDVFPSPAETEIEPEITNEHLTTLRAPFGFASWLKDQDGRLDVSPGTLHRLKDIPELKPLLKKATTDEPLHPALTKPLLEAWSMTSLAEHPGRPEVEPWLRGWVKHEPQTRVLWRRLLPVRQDDDAALRRKTLDAFFQSAPPRLSEILEALTSEVVDTMQRRAKALLAAREKEAAKEETPLNLPAIGAVTLTPRGEVEQILAFAELARLPSKQLFAILAGRTVVLDAALGGLDDAGLLDANAATPPPTLDAETDAWGADFLAAADYRVRRVRADTPRDPDWPVEWRCRIDPEDASDDGEEIRVEVLRRAAATSGNAAIAKRPQALKEHHDWAACEAAMIADAVGLREPYRGMLIAAAAAHDAGKARELWQRAMGAPRENRPYAKTRGGGIPALLGGYRHEFGSLRDVKKGGFLSDVPENVRELGLHLIASHHGFARPVIAAIDPDPEAPPSACAELAREAALRFARLQAEWGVWGLAWWEALLRAADWAASRKLNETEEQG